MSLRRPRCNRLTRLSPPISRAILERRTKAPRSPAAEWSVIRLYRRQRTWSGLSRRLCRHSCRHSGQMPARMRSWPARMPAPRRRVECLLTDDGWPGSFAELFPGGGNIITDHFMKTWVWIALIAPLAAAPLPPGHIPPGKVLLVIEPHHDDHTTDYGMGGLIARFVDEGYKAYYVRASNDEKDGNHGYPHNDMVNLRESTAATKILGMEQVISLNWRNDYMDSIPLQELRAQLILLIRKYRPDVVLGHDPWAHYDRNPDHRKVARALGEASWMAGYATIHPEHMVLGLKPHREPYLCFKARPDYGKGD